MRLRLPVALLTAALLLGLGSGCSTVKRFIPGNQPEKKLPPQELIVGGGFQIDYTAPRNGTVVLADRNRGQILVTRSMSAGERYQFNFDPHAPQNAGLFGDDLSDARPTLYFLPEGFQMPAANAASAPSPETSVYGAPPSAAASSAASRVPTTDPAPASAPAPTPAPVVNPFDDPAPAANPFDDPAPAVN